MSSPSKSARQVFLEAIESYAPGEWPAFLDRTCGDDAQLRHRVEVLLEAHVEEVSLLDIPVVAPVPTIDKSLRERPGTQIGPYTLLQQIGEGGFGVVFMAEQREPVRRKVALKLIKPGMDTRQVIARFEAERQALAVMDHPNIARVFDAGATESGRPYFVMELVRGTSITQYCDENSLTIRERLALFASVCQAIQHAHTKGIIHRDIKPTNVLVTRQDGQPVVKVIDFGIAKALGQQLTDKTLFTDFTQMIGTPLYMSPEQAELSGTYIDTRSDIYSLGVLLYELLTGSTPVSKEQLKLAAFDEIRRIIREDEAQRPSNRISTAETAPSIAAQRHTEPAKLAKIVRGELDWIVMKCLEKDRNHRYETANAFAADVQRYLADEPVLACPPSAAYQLRKFARRNKVALAMGAVIATAMVVAVVGLAVSNVMVAHARDQTKKALKNESAALTKALEQEGRANERAEEAGKQEKIAKDQALLAHRRYNAAQMNLAMQAWRAGEVPRVLELLESVRPRAGEDDLRGFEWFYLWRLCNGGHRVPIQGHTNAVLSLAHSPDGKMLASASWDRTVRLWDTLTGKELKVLQGGHPRGVWEVAFSPDGTKLVSSGKETGAMIVWDVGTSQPLHTIAGSVMGMRFTPDGKSIIGGLVGNGYPDELKVDFKEWDVASGEVKATIADAGIVVGLIPASKALVTFANPYSPAGEIRFWDLMSGKRRMTIPHLWIATAVLSPDGSQVATATGATIKLSDTTTGHLLSEYSTQSTPQGLAFSPDGKRIAAGLEDRRVVVWDIDTGKPIAEDVHVDPVYGLAFSPDGKTLASSTLAGAVKLWDMAPAEEATTIPGIEPISGQSPNFGRCVRFTPDGKALLVGNAGMTKLIDVAAGKEIAVLPASSVGAISADAHVLAGRAGADGCVLWDVQAGRKLATIPFPKDVLPTAVLSGDGSTLAYHRGWHAENTVTLWDVATQRSKMLKIGPPESNRLSVVCAEFSPDRKLLAAGFQFQWVTVWDVATGKVKLQFIQKPSMMSVISVAFSPNGKTLAVGTNVGAVTLWDVETGKRLVAFRGHTTHVYGLAFSPDGQTLATAGADRAVRLWDVVTGQERTTLTGHMGRVTNVVFSPDGFTLATASDDGTVKLWQAATDGEAMAPRGDIAGGRSAAPLSLPPGAIGLTEAGLRDAVRRWPDDTDLHRQLGLVLQRQGQFAEAETAFREVVRLKPDNAWGHRNLGVALVRQKKFSQAVASLREAIRLGPTDHWVYDALGWALVEQGQFAEAEAAFREVVRLKPDLFNGHSGLGRALAEQKKFAEAVAPLREAIRLDPTQHFRHGALGWAFLGQHLLRDAEAEFREQVRLKPDAADAHVHLGEALVRQKKFAEAEASLREGLRLNSQHPWAPQALANVLIQQGKLTEANSFLTELLQREPENVETLAKLGNVLRQQKRFAEAEATLREALKLNPTHPWTHSTLGWLLWDQKKFAEAELALREAACLKPDLPDAQFGLGRVLQDQKKFDEAVGPLREALRLDPTLTQIHGHLGWVFIEQQSYAEAEAEFREYIRLKPNHADSHFGLGRALQVQKKFAESEAPLREAMRLRPDHAPSHSMLGWTLIRLQRFTEAEGEFREAIRLQNGLAGPHFGLGEALFNQRKFADAEAAVREAIRLNPGDSQAPRLLSRALAAQGKPQEEIPATAAKGAGEPSPKP